MQAGQPPHCSLMNYMIPVVAMLVGIAVVGERFEWRSLVALALILLGLPPARPDRRRTTSSSLTQDS